MIDEKVKLHCTDNDKDLDGYILSYKPKAYLEVAIQTLKIRMAYQERTKVFVGSLGGKEFVLKESGLPVERKEFSRK